jgi:hypothetical protein
VNFANVKFKIAKHVIANLLIIAIPALMIISTMKNNNVYKKKLIQIH